MTKNKHFLDIAKFVVIDIIGNIFYFPIWWYSQGLLRVLQWVKNQIRSFSDFLAYSILFKNLLTPMFGQRDLAGRLISIFYRFIYFILLSILFFIWLSILFLLILIYLTLPIFIVYNILYQLEVFNNYLLINGAG